VSIEHSLGALQARSAVIGKPAASGQVDSQGTFRRGLAGRRSTTIETFLFT
jgi:hypothetical protein